MAESVLVRPARETEAPLIFSLLGELAEYERLTDVFSTQEADIRTMLFGPAPRAFCLIAEWAEEPVGLALWFYIAATFSGGYGIHLEDLFVRPHARGHGVGKALMAALARRCAEEGLAGLQWAVLDWNAPAIAFYDSLGAETAGGWITRRLGGEALARLARG